MRSISAGIQAELSKEQQHMLTFVEIETVGPTLRGHNGRNEVTWNAVTWYGLGDYLGFEDVEETADLQASALRLTLSGLSEAPDTQSWVSKALDGTDQIEGRPVRMWWVWFTDATFLTVIDGLQIFAGLADRWTLDRSFSDPTLSLIVENRLIEARDPTGRLWTDDDQRTYVNPDDGFFKGVSQIQEIDLGQWGET